VPKTGHFRERKHGFGLPCLNYAKNYPQITQIFADYYLKIIPFRLYVAEEQLECQTGTLYRSL
jgi:hypothetical protein